MSDISRNARRARNYFRAIGMHSPGEALSPLVAQLHLPGDRGAGDLVAR